MCPKGAKNEIQTSSCSTISTVKSPRFHGTITHLAKPATLLKVQMCDKSKHPKEKGETFFRFGYATTTHFLRFLTPNSTPTAAGPASSATASSSHPKKKPDGRNQTINVAQVRLLTSIIARRPPPPTTNYESRKWCGLLGADT